MDTSAPTPDSGGDRPRTRAGRPRDHAADGSILATALDLLAEGDWERVTLDEVAARSGRAKTTLYRRWPTKTDLFAAAVRAAGPPPELASPPDTGSLRGDLLAVVDSGWLGGPDRRLAIFAGLASAARGSSTLAEVVRTGVTEPYIEVYRLLLARAVSRGEVGAEHEPRIPLLAEVIPAMSTHRLARGGAAVRRDFSVAVVDDVVLAALRPSA